MLKSDLVEENLSAFREHAFPQLGAQIRSWPSRIWFHGFEPLLRILFHCFFIISNVVSGILSAVLWWSSRFCARPVFTIFTTAIVLAAMLAVLDGLSYRPKGSATRNIILPKHSATEHQPIVSQKNSRCAGQMN
ncbi:MAG: hypothetical protein A2428_08730 [Bdellovibrionales bacterium RIFOXYC1_FULL_54_43]|nr:MAG: hypothetical protein A2428_08730 [Bdellovibrionales bacterium RIFOXYC1_FULL_54_43]OFZ81358.1 MAG: hypothetical protein A2603_08340 [Bdellovibrionales bacterium RIFOXYD1_FULL_55_31]